MKNVNLKENEKAAIAELKQQLSKRFKIYDFCIFGSKARGEASTESDIDVMVVVEDNTSDIASRIDDIVYEINLAHDCLISMTIFGKKELEEGPLGESPLYRSIRVEGVKV